MWLIDVFNASYGMFYGKFVVGSVVALIFVKEGCYGLYSG